MEGDERAVVRRRLVQGESSRLFSVVRERFACDASHDRKPVQVRLFDGNVHSYFREVERYISMSTTSEIGVAGLSISHVPPGGAG